jgi:hypothetical protein
MERARVFEKLKLRERDTIPKPVGLGSGGRAKPILFDVRSSDIRWKFNGHSMLVQPLFDGCSMSSAVR